MNYSKFITTALLLVAPSLVSAQDMLDPRRVTYLHTSIADWPVTSTITSVTGITLDSREICIHHTKAGQWPTLPFGEIEIEGTPWVFAPVNGQWYGATWDRMRPGQVCKVSETAPWLRIMGAWQTMGAKPLDASWVPAPGSPICFAVSTPAREFTGPALERSNIFCTTVPGGPPQPLPTPTPAPTTPTPQPPQVPPQTPSQPDSGLVLKLDEIAAGVLRVEAEVVRAREERWGWGDFWTFLAKYIAPLLGGLVAGWQLFPDDTEP